MRFAFGVPQQAHTWPQQHPLMVAPAAQLGSPATRGPPPTWSPSPTAAWSGRCPTAEQSRTGQTVQQPRTDRTTTTVLPSSQSFLDHEVNVKPSLVFSLWHLSLLWIFHSEGHSDTHVPNQVWSHTRTIAAAAPTARSDSKRQETVAATKKITCNCSLILCLLCFY